MNENFQAEIAAEVERISQLPLEEQPEAFAALRDQLERALNAAAQEANE
ncbi:MAG: hypothetical protein RLZZ443_388 [Actinomycetota bacterium]|mgnify:CR=1 FL=1|jgi:hypothetical protein